MFDLASTIFKLKHMCFETFNKRELMMQWACRVTLLVILQIMRVAALRCVVRSSSHLSPW